MGDDFVGRLKAVERPAGGQSAFGEIRPPCEKPGRAFWSERPGKGPSGSETVFRSAGRFPAKSGGFDDDPQRQDVADADDERRAAFETRSF
jgi:hypothetical protein